MPSTIQLGTLLGKDTSRGCFPSQPRPTCPYKREVDYRGFNEAIRVTVASYHWSKMQDASTSNQSLSTMLTLQLLLYSSQIKNKALKKVVNLMNNINKKLTWIRSWLLEISKASSNRTWIHQGTSHREGTNRLASPPNSSLTLHLTIIYKIGRASCRERV